MAGPAGAPRGSGDALRFVGATRGRRVGSLWSAENRGKNVEYLYTPGGVLVDFPLMRLVFNRLAQVLLLAPRGGLRAVRVAATDLKHWKVGQRWADPWSMQNEISFKENHASP
jgi:hypothetical protein